MKQKLNKIVIISTVLVTTFCGTINAAPSNTMDDTIIVDKTPPRIYKIDTEKTTNSIKIDVSASDDLAGLDDKPYIFKINEEGVEQWQNSNEYLFQGLQVNTGYNIRIKVKDCVGNVKEENLLNVYTEAYVPSVTVDTASQTTIEGTINLEGNPSNTETLVEVAEDIGFTQNVRIVKDWNTSTQFTASGLSGGKTYYFRVRARNGNNEETANSTIVSMITIPDTPAAPIVVPNADSTKMDISWSAVEGTDIYVLYRDGVEIYRGTDLSYTDSNLEANKQYSYNLKAINSSGESPLSASASKYTLALDPTSVDLVNTTSSSITVKIIDNPLNAVTPEWKVLLKKTDGTLIGIRDFSSDTVVTFDSGLEEDTIYVIFIITRNGDLFENTEYLALAGIKTNAKPEITITTADNEFYSEEDNHNEITLNGTVKDIDAGDILKVYYTIDGQTAHQNINIATITADTTEQAYSYSVIVDNTIAEGTHNLYVWVEDNRGGKSDVKSITVNIDKTPPVVTVIGDSEVNVIIDESYVELGATAIDNMDGDITSNIVIIDGNVDTEVETVYTIKYYAKDRAGNVGLAIRKVTILNPYRDKLDAITIVDGADGHKDINLPLLDPDQYYELTLIDLDTNTNVFENRTSLGEIIDFTGTEGHSYKLVAKIYNKNKLRGTKEFTFTIPDKTNPVITGIYVLNGRLYLLGTDNYKLSDTPYGFKLNGDINQILTTSDGTFKVSIKIDGSKKVDIDFTAINSIKVNVGDEVLVLLCDYWNNITGMKVKVSSLNEVIYGDVPPEVIREIDRNNYVPPEQTDIPSGPRQNNDENIPAENIIGKDNNSVIGNDGLIIDDDGNLIIDDNSKSAKLELLDTLTGEKRLFEITVTDGESSTTQEPLVDIAYAIKNNLSIDLNKLVKDGYELVSVNSDVSTLENGILYTKAKGIGEIVLRGPDGQTYYQKYKIEDKSLEDKEYTDIKGHWAEETIKAMTREGLLEGYSDNTFRPDNKVTRAEFITTINRVMVLNRDNYIKERVLNPVLNLHESDWYFYNLADFANEHSVYEILYVFEDLDYNKPISREEAAYLLTTKLDLLFDVSDFVDIKNSKFKEEITTAKVNNLMIGYTNNTFNPSNNLTRAELATILERIVKNRNIIDAYTK